MRIRGAGKRYPLDGLGGRAMVRRVFGGESAALWALRNVSLDIARGETVGVIGRNGSGKSTLLGIACGTLEPTEGAVERTGRVAALLELGAGFHPDFTGRENVLMNARLLGMGRQQAESRMDAIAAFAAIGDALERPVKTYSTGMYLRLAFAVAAHVDADLLVIDEALAVGDAAFMQKCMRFLREFPTAAHRGAGGGILFVSHDVVAVTSLCTRALWLDAGRILREGPAKQVCEAYHAALATGTGAPASSPEEFGDGGAAIEAVRVEDPAGHAIAVVTGGERVHVAVRMRAERLLARPIVGFYVKNRLGQQLFGENTGPDIMQPCAAGDLREVHFAFDMPVLPPGEYTVDAAIAEADEAGGHRIVRWLRDAAVIHSAASDGHRGLVGIAVRVEVR